MQACSSQNTDNKSDTEKEIKSLDDAVSLQLAKRFFRNFKI